METFYLLFSHLITHTTYTMRSTYSKEIKRRDRRRRGRRKKSALKSRIKTFEKLTWTVSLFYTKPAELKFLFTNCVARFYKLTNILLKTSLI